MLLPRMDGYGEDLAAIHAAGFTALASAAARELLPRVEPMPRGLVAYLARKLS